MEVSKTLKNDFKNIYRTLKSTLKFDEESQNVSQNLNIPLHFKVIFKLSEISAIIPVWASCFTELECNFHRTLILSR